MSQPISPLEVINKIADSKPPIVIDAFNELIVENWNGHQSKFTQDDVIGRIEMKQTLCSVFDHRWLDVEDAFRKVGWQVTYEKPSYDENFKACFVFRKAEKFKASWDNG